MIWPSRSTPARRGSPRSFQKTGANTIHYLYDFGHSWDHVVKLGKWFDNTTIEGRPLLLEAAGRFPSEDVGETPRYCRLPRLLIQNMKICVTGGPNSFDPKVVD
ncbi:plasmid pRiA4b ORF-3 family protein [Bradyrhizobium canariense]|uniref:plasmid pRiA4b ORF-3 family protein n=1 Tax=Bradyrhizobium canariense TaxID=255045 RepID=UPI001FEEA99C|nr:plasmid pRiA4b ORF-3 family protein [Bradyrhizobium canariense]